MCSLVLKQLYSCVVCQTLAFLEFQPMFRRKMFQCIAGFSTFTCNDFKRYYNSCCSFFFFCESKPGFGTFLSLCHDSSLLQVSSSVDAETQSWISLFCNAELSEKHAGIDKRNLHVWRHSISVVLHVTGSRFPSLT